MLSSMGYGARSHRTRYHDICSCFLLVCFALNKSVDGPGAVPTWIGGQRGILQRPLSAAGRHPVNSTVDAYVPAEETAGKGGKRRADGAPFHAPLKVSRLGDATQLPCTTGKQMQEEPAFKLPEQSDLVTPSLGPGRFAFASGRAALPARSISMGRIKEIFGDDFPTPCIPLAPEQTIPDDNIQGAARVCSHLSVDEDGVRVLPDSSAERSGRSVQKGFDQDGKAHSNSTLFATFPPHGCEEGCSRSAQLGATNQSQLSLAQQELAIAGQSWKTHHAEDRSLEVVRSNLPGVGRGKLSTEDPCMQASVSDREGRGLQMPLERSNLLGSSPAGPNDRPCPGGAHGFDAPLPSLADANPEGVPIPLQPEIPTRDCTLLSPLQPQGRYVVSTASDFMLGNKVPALSINADSAAVLQVPSDRLPVPVVVDGFMNCLVPSSFGQSLTMDGTSRGLGPHAFQPKSTCEAAAAHPMSVPSVMRSVPLATADVQYGASASTAILQLHAPVATHAPLGHGAAGFPTKVSQDSNGDPPTDRQSRDLPSDETKNPLRSVKGIGQRPLIRPVSRSRLQSLLADIMADAEGGNDTIEAAGENACTVACDQPNVQAAALCLPAVDEHADGGLVCLNRTGLQNSTSTAAPDHPTKNIRGGRANSGGSILEQDDPLYLREPCPARDGWHQQPAVSADLPQANCAFGSSLNVATSAHGQADCESPLSGPNKDPPHLVHGPCSLPSTVGRDFGFASGDAIPLQASTSVGTDLARVRHATEDPTRKERVLPQSPSAG